MKNIELGTFNIESDLIRISDPCYNKGVWGTTCMEVVNGIWRAEIVKSEVPEWGECVVHLKAHHFEYHSDGQWIVSDAEIGVDSGQAGFFDEKYYKCAAVIKDLKHNHTPICRNYPWYSICCDRTRGINGAAVIPFGVVSQSGFGDGGYDLLYQQDSMKRVTALWLVFILNRDLNGRTYKRV